MIKEVVYRFAKYPDPPLKSYLLGSCKMSESCGVYFLYLDGVCVYVGQSNNIQARTSSHDYKCERMYVACFEFDEKDLDYAESYYIGLLKPSWNFGRKFSSGRRERQAAGILAARAAGKYTGRKKGTTKVTPEHARNLRAEGLRPEEIADRLNVSRNTVFRYLRSSK